MYIVCIKNAVCIYVATPGFSIVNTLNVIKGNFILKPHIATNIVHYQLTMYRDLHMKLEPNP